MGHCPSRPRMRVLVIFCALVSIAIAGGRVGKGGKGGKVDKDGKDGKGGKGKDGESMATMMGGKDEMMQEMMDEEGLCLSNDQVHMMCGIGTKLQEKMDAALKQCVPVPPEMMAATMEDMQDTSMIPNFKLLSSGRAFTLDEPAERKKGKKRPLQMDKKNMKYKKDKKDKKSKKPSKKGKKQNKSTKNKKPSKKPSKPSDFK